MITLTIDGTTMEVAPGSTILEASLAHGIDIPRLCYHPELAPLGGCRLCLVEIEGQPTPAAQLWRAVCPRHGRPHAERRAHAAAP